MEGPIHQGRNVKRFREMLGIKQEALAAELGEDWNQKKISILEQKESIEIGLLQQIANQLNLPVEAFTNFDEGAAINIISSTLHDNAGSINNNSNLTFNPIEKLIQAFEENKELYERLLQAEKDKVTLLEKLIGQQV